MWTRDERIFAALAWCPKATVQAALSTVALDMVEERARRGFYDDADGSISSSISSSSSSSSISGGGGAAYDEDRDRANALLTVAVASILLTAIPFSGIIAHFGPRLLAGRKVQAAAAAEA